MNKSDIKNVIGKLMPDKELELRLSGKILHKQPNKLYLKHMSSIAASVVIVVSLGISEAFNKFWTSLE